MGACHGNPNGKGGFRLSLRGEDPVFDLDFADPRRPRPSGQSRPSRSEPDRSQADGTDRPRRRACGSRSIRRRPSPRRLDRAREQRTILATAPRLIRLDVFPARADERGPLPLSNSPSPPNSPTAPRRDVTRQASYDVSDPTKVVGHRPTAWSRRKARPRPTVAVRYLDGRGVSRLTFLARPARLRLADRRAEQRRRYATSSPSSSSRRSTLPSPSTTPSFSAGPPSTRSAVSPRLTRPVRSSPTTIPETGRSSSTACSPGPSSPISGP